MQRQKENIPHDKRTQGLEPQDTFLKTATDDKMRPSKKSIKTSMLGLRTPGGKILCKFRTKTKQLCTLGFQTDNGKFRLSIYNIMK